MLMSEREDCVALLSCGMAGAYQVKVFSICAANSRAKVSKTLRQIANVLEEIVIGNEGGDGGEESGGGGDEGFGDTGSDGTEAGSPAVPRPEKASMMPQTVPKRPMME